MGQHLQGKPAMNTGRQLAHSVAFLVVLGVVLAVLARAAAPCYPQVWQARKTLRQALERPEEIRSLIVGSSHALGVRPQATGENGINLAHAGADLFEIAHIMRWAREDLPMLRVVLVGVSFFSFGYDNAAYLSRGKNPRADIRRRMYAILPGWRALPGDGDLLLQGKLFSLVTSDHWRRVLWPAAPGIDAEGTQVDGEVVASPVPSLREHAEHRSGDLESTLHNVARRHPDVELDSANALQEASLALKKVGVRVIFFVAPVHRTFLERYDANLRKKMHRQLQALANSIQAPVLDFSQSEQFLDQDALFANSDHLDPGGLAKFHRVLETSLLTTSDAGSRPTTGAVDRSPESSPAAP